MYSRIVLCTFLTCIVGAVFAAIPPNGGVTKDSVCLVDRLSINKLPFSVQLRNGNGDIVCAGTLITVQHVLTAAQCFENYGPTELTVVAGATAKSDTGVQRSIEKVFKHDTYNAATFYNDAAVLKLQSPVELSDVIATLDVCSEQLVVPTNMVRLFGWHKSEQDELHIMPTAVFAKEECSKRWQDESILTEYPDSSMCDNCVQRFPCTHVPGSGAMWGNDVCGIVIGGPGCDDPTFPGVITSVYEIRDFILNTVKATSD